MVSLIKQFGSREHTPLVQFVKYGICGGIATFVHIAIFFLCAWLVLPALGLQDPLVQWFGLHVTPIEEGLRARNATLDNLIAFVFSNATAYTLNILWVFEGGRHHRLVEIGMFFAVSALSLAVGTVLQFALIRSFGLATTVAFAANIVASVMINYVMRKFVVFKG